MRMQFVERKAGGRSFLLNLDAPPPEDTRVQITTVSAGSLRTIKSYIVVGQELDVTRTLYRSGREMEEAKYTVFIEELELKQAVRPEPEAVSEAAPEAVSETVSEAVSEAVPEAEKGVLA